MVFGGLRVGGDSEKEADGLDGVANFKQKHACHAVCVTPRYIVIGGSKVHFFDKQGGNEHVREIKTGTEISALHFSHEGERIYVGFADGTVKTCHIPKDAPDLPDSLEAGKKMHQASICTLDFHERLFCGSSDGAISVWGSPNTIAASREKPKKGPKHCVVKFFPKQQLSLVTAPGDKVLVFKGVEFDEEKAGSLIGITSSVKALAGFATDAGARAFVGCEDGTVLAYDIKDGGEEGNIGALRELQKIHTKSIHCMEMFGHYLCATAHDKLVSMWNGNVASQEFNLLRKLRHKGLVTAMCVDGGPSDNDGALWCFDESNKKVYNVVMKEHLPSLSRGHQTKLTFDVGDESAVAIDTALSPAPVSLTASDAELPGNVSLEGTGGDISLQYKDFYSDSGAMQSVFDMASAWISAQKGAVKVWSVNTVPIIGSKSTGDALFRHSLSQSGYDATLRTKPENAVSVIHVVRVVYS